MAEGLCPTALDAENPSPLKPAIITRPFGWWDGEPPDADESRRARGEWVSTIAKRLGVGHSTLYGAWRPSDPPTTTPPE